MSLRNEFTELRDELFSEFEAFALSLTLTNPAPKPLLNDAPAGMEQAAESVTLTGFRPQYSQRVLDAFGVPAGEAVLLIKADDLQQFSIRPDHTEITVSGQTGVITAVPSLDAAGLNYRIRAAFSG